MKNKLKELKEFQKLMEKDYGKGTVGLFDSISQEGLECMTTGSLLLDRTIGCGFPRGRIVEIYGPEQSGKTTLAIHAIKYEQSIGNLCAFIDVEQAYPKEFAEQIGVNHSELFFVQPDNAEQAIDIMSDLITSGKFSLVILDSIAALLPIGEAESSAGDNHIGLRARLMGKVCRKFPPILRKTNTTAIFINQIREKVGVMFGSPETTPGGNAMKFTASLRLDIRKKERIGPVELPTGHKMQVTVKKSKISPNFGRKCLVPLYYGYGFDEVGELGVIAEEIGVVQKRGSWYYLGDTKIGQGEASLRQFIEDNPDLKSTIKEKMKT